MKKVTIEYVVPDDDDPMDAIGWKANGRGETLNQALSRRGVPHRITVETQELVYVTESVDDYEAAQLA